MWNSVSITRFCTLNWDFTFNWDSLNRDFTVFSDLGSMKIEFVVNANEKKTIGNCEACQKLFRKPTEKIIYLNNEWMNHEWKWLRKERKKEQREHFRNILHEGEIVIIIIIIAINAVKQGVHRPSSIAHNVILIQQRLNLTIFTTNSIFIEPKSENTVKSRFIESQLNVKSLFKVQYLMIGKEIHIKKPQFSVKSRFKELKWADGGHVQYWDFFVYWILWSFSDLHFKGKINYFG